MMIKNTRPRLAASANHFPDTGQPEDEFDLFEKDISQMNEPKTADEIAFEPNVPLKRVKA